MEEKSLVKGENAQLSIAGCSSEGCGVQPTVPEPKDFTMVLTLAPKLLDAIFFPGTWKGFETAST